MRGKVLIPALAIVTLWGSTAAMAGPAYRAEDIVERFAPEKSLGATRGLCIGTHSECNKGVESRKTAGSFDLMVNFDYNSDALTPAAMANLDEFAKALQNTRLRSANFVVEGHTDARGGDAFNLDLSARRANAVVKYLAGRGVQPGQLVAKGYGEVRPLSANPLDPANRRVETRLAP